MHILTYGWDRKRPTYIYTLCVFVVIWAVAVSAAVYSLIQERTHPRTGPTFDASNPVHLMMASSAGGLETPADNATTRLSDSVVSRTSTSCFYLSRMVLLCGPDG
ncbi:hypothetical protein BDR03DRAFT_662705 [Suillus americanus]|nr:hypothetical protein BDR03DRAFT_662705 [Suillus americanus]